MKIFKRKVDPTSQVIKNIIDENPIPLSEETKEKWEEAYKKMTESLEATARSEAEKFDKGLLSLSSIFLGFTLTFVDKIVPLNTSWYMWILITSWISFFISILSILTGLLLNQESIKQTIYNSKKYLIDHNANYSNFSTNKLNRIASVLNYVSLIFFVLGVVSFMGFVYMNISRY